MVLTEHIHLQIDSSFAVPIGGNTGVRSATVSSDGSIQRERGRIGNNASEFVIEGIRNPSIGGGRKGVTFATNFR